MGEDRVHRFRSSHLRVGLQTACHLPIDIDNVSWDPPCEVGAFALTSGTLSFSAWDEAASVVTDRFARGTKAFRLNGKAQGALKALEIMIARY